jgi:hypothetical protein
MMESIMKKLMIITMLAVLTAGCNGPTDAEKKIHQDQDNKETQAEKALDKKMPDFNIASKPKEELSLQDQIDKYCDPDTPMYKQGPKCSKAVAKIQKKAMAKLESDPITIKRLNHNLSDDDVGALLNCQLTKYAEDYGQKAATVHAEDILFGLMLAEYQHPKDKFDKQIKKGLEEEGAQPIYADKDHDTVQAQLIDEGYTCSLGEINNYR